MADDTSTGSSRRAALSDADTALAAIAEYSRLFTDRFVELVQSGRQGTVRLEARIDKRRVPFVHVTTDEGCNPTERS